ncbi:MAG: ABC-2 family transporter protein [Armatimonadetes bacterium]|nr:ABC-2 family transporter protein [Armatimonadota bacterium]MDW8123124.1 ABC-2 family transporter protein [Armatimonadota bacterium]
MVNPMETVNIAEKKRGSGIKPYWRVLKTFIGISASEETTYRAHFFFSVLETLFWLVWFLAIVRVYFLHAQNLGGWTFQEVLAVVGVFQIVHGVIQLVLQPNIGRLVEYVRLGTLDFVLTKPLNSQFLVSLRYWSVLRGVNCLAGLGLVVYVGTDLGLFSSPLYPLWFLILLASGLTIVYSIMLMVMTLCFWFVRLENLMAILWAFWETGRYPISVYRGIPRAILTYLIPVAFVTTVPARAVRGDIDWVNGVAAVGTATVLFVAASAFWKIALRRYTGASA